MRVKAKNTLLIVPLASYYSHGSASGYSHYSASGCFQQEHQRLLVAGSNPGGFATFCVREPDFPLPATEGL